MTLMDQTFYNNTVQSWLLALGVFLLALAALLLVRGLLRRHSLRFARRTENKVDDLVAELVGHTNWLLLAAVALNAGSLLLQLPERIVGLINALTILALLVQAAFWGNRVLGFGIEHYLKREGEPPAVASTAVLRFTGRLVLWSVVLLLALENLGVDVTALIASLGVGGIAVALAAQNILGDLFSSLSIVLDKPFVVGDFIVVDDLRGTVEYIGMKTTRIRSLTGEQLVFSNTDLLSSRVRNFKRMQQRRISFGFGVTYQTPYGKLVLIPEMVREIIQSLDELRFDRAHFKDYGDSALNFEVIYWVQSPDYTHYMDRQQTINLELYRRFEEAGIEFAYPTQTLYVRPEAGVEELVADRLTG